MDILLVLLMFLAILTYHAEQTRYFKEVYGNLANLDQPSNKNNEPDYRTLRTLDRDAKPQ
jgi:hypothetical protein